MDRAPRSRAATLASLGLEDDVTEELHIDPTTIADFCRRHGVRRLSVFGSVLRADFRADSDIDVLVEFEPGHVPGLAFFEMQRELSELLGRRVDLNTAAFLSPYIRDRVLAEAKVPHAA